MLEMVNGKTIDQVISGLRCDSCRKCPYDRANYEDGESHCFESESDAIILIDALLRERRAMLEDLRGTCIFCAYRMPCYAFQCNADEGEWCKDCKCADCINGSNWEWRGIQSNEEDICVQAKTKEN